MKKARVLTRAVVVFSLVALARPVWSDGLDAERFVPAVGTEPSFQFEHPSVPFHLGWGLGLFLNFADDPVVARDEDGSGDVVARPVDSAFSADLLGSLGLFGWGEVGLLLPIRLVYEGDDVMAGGANLSASGGVGDLRLVPKAALIRRGDAESHFLLGAALPLTFPTGDPEALRGAGGVTVEPRLTAAFHTGPLGLGLGAGYRWRADHPTGLPWGDEIALSAMAQYEIAPDSLLFQAELFGGKQVGTDVDGADFPFEALGGLIWSVTDSIDLHGGAGLGFTDGIGDPDFRVVAGVRFHHRVPERHGFTDSDGDGLIDNDDDCPDEPEDQDGFKDEDGCPEPDNDEDGVLDDKDECPELPEEEGGDGDGCPSKTYVKVEDGQLVIHGKVQFKTGSAEIDKKSDPLLDQIAAAMKANPQIKHVRIEGHTDDVGGDDINQRLSEDRAKSVKSALVDRGTEDGRLRTAGYGESKPIAPNRTRAGRAKNRRVEFIVED